VTRRRRLRILSDMRTAVRYAILITGGPATRLRPLTDVMPKRCVPVGNVPVQDHIVRWLARHGVRGVLLGSSDQEPTGSLPDPGSLGVEEVRAVREPEPLGTGGFVRLAMEGLDGLVAVMNGDILTDLDLTAMTGLAASEDADAVIAVRRVDDPSSFGVLELADDGTVRRFLEKPAPGDMGSDLANGAVYVLHPRALAHIAPGSACSLELELFPWLVESGRKVLGWNAGETYWLDIGTHVRYLQANRDTALGASPLAARGVRREGWLADEGALVHPATSVGGGSVLGRGTIVSDGASVQGSVLLTGARVGPNAVVVDSVLGPGARVESGQTVRGTILCAAIA